MSANGNRLLDIGHRAAGRAAGTAARGASRGVAQSPQIDRPGLYLLVRAAGKVAASGLFSADAGTLTKDTFNA